MNKVSGKRILISGATGFVGRRAVEIFLALGWTVGVLTRNPRKTQSLWEAPVDTYFWDPQHPDLLGEKIGEYNAILNLSGEPVAEGRWSASRKKTIGDSRVLGTRYLVEAISMAKRSPEVLVNASAVGFYGDAGDRQVSSRDARGEGFLPEVCEAWEKEAIKARHLGVRVVLPRIGLVLGKKGGVLGRMLPVFTAGLGGPLGSGNQWMPWIHRDDLVKIFAFAIENACVHGPFNASAPSPERMKDFCRTLAAVLKRPCRMRVPAVMLKLALGEMSEVLLAGQKALPENLLDWGYQFCFPNLPGAFAAILMDQLDVQ